MVETFEIIKKINGKQVAKFELNEEEFRLLREGLYYAKSGIASQREGLLTIN